MTALMPVVDASVAFDTLIECTGNSKLAAERIAQRLGIPLTEVTNIRSQLPALVAGRLPELKQHMEAVATLELFSLLPILSKTLTENLTRLEPGESVSAYMKLMDLIHKKTDPNELNININDQRWKLVPREIQDIYTRLEANGQLGQIIEGESRVIE